MKSGESLEDFIVLFLLLCYDFSKEDVNWDFMGETFSGLVRIFSKQFESQSLDDFDYPTHRNHEAPPIWEEEPTTSFFPSPPPLWLPNKVVRHFYVEIGKYENEIIDPLIPP